MLDAMNFKKLLKLVSCEVTGVIGYQKITQSVTGKINLRALVLSLALVIETILHSIYFERASTAIRQI